MENIETCDSTIIHEDIIAEVKQHLPSDQVLSDLSEFYKTFADMTRLKIMTALAESEMCVCDLAHLIGVSQSAVSHQLRLLRHHRLVKTRRDGKVIYYSLDDDHVMTVIKQGLNHVQHG